MSGIPAEWASHLVEWRAGCCSCELGPCRSGSAEAWKGSGPSDPWWSMLNKGVEIRSVVVFYVYELRGLFVLRSMLVQ